MKKLFSIIIISLLVWNTCILPVAAATPSIVIDGGAVAGGGVAGGTNAKGDVVSVIASLVLASQGVKINAASGSTPIEFIKELLKNYADLVGISFETLCDLWLSNVKIMADGAISMGMNTCQMIYQWLSYLKNGDMIYTPSLSDEYVLIGNVKCPVVDYEKSIDVFADSRNDIYGRKNYSDSKLVIFWSDDYVPRTLYILSLTSPIKIMIMLNGNSLTGISESIGNPIGNFYYLRNSIGSSVSEWFVPYVPDGYNAISSLSGLVFESDVPDESNLSGDPDDVNPDDFDIQSGTSNILSTGIDLSALASAFGLDGTVTISNYIDAIINAINGVDDNVIKVNDSVTGILENIPLGDYDIYDSTSISTDTDSGNGVSIIDDSQYPDAETTQQYIKHMQFNLINVFPFCIPFDIVNLLSKLDVEPVTPHVNLSFPNPVLDEPIVFDLDFSQWNGVAQVVRNAELVAFVVGLAMVTRNLIRG